MLSTVLIVAPSRRMAATFDGDAPVGRNTEHGTPRAAAAVATPIPWLPDDAVTMPAAASSGEREKTLLSAPRSLKLPVRCLCSALMAMVAPIRSDIGSLIISGVLAA